MEDWQSYLDNTEVIVHCGGMSERWYPVTQGRIPKVLTEIGSKPRPMIDWTILPYVKAGIKKFYVTLWHQADMIVQHCNALSEKSGMEFVFLMEEGKRMGRAGVVKHYLENGTLDANKHKINVGGSDIVNLNLENFIKFHLEGIQKGFLLTLVGSSSGHSQFDKIVFDPMTKRVIRMDSDRTISLVQGEHANTGTSYFDSKLNSVFLKIPENLLPVDWENFNEFFTNARCFESAKIYDSWLPMKTPYDYKKAKDVDFEKWYGINSADELLG